MPNEARRNLRVFNGLDFARNVHGASGRETGSGWNTPRLGSNRLPAGPKYSTTHVYLPLSAIGKAFAA